MKRFFIITALHLTLYTLHLFSLTLSTEKIAFCDIEKVFNSYSLTQISRKQLKEEKKKIEEAIKKLEEEIKNLEDKILNIKKSTYTVSTSSVSISTQTLPGLSLEEEIEKKRKELKVKKERFKKELEKKEEDIREQIIYRIYKVIEEIANEEGYTIILDKSQLLYSTTARDITDEVIKKLEEKFK